MVSHPSDRGLPAIDECMLVDRHRFKQHTRTGKSPKQLARLSANMERSRAKAQSRNQDLSIDFPDTLPICQRLEDILAAIESHQVVIVAGETGSGKTTQLPKLLLKAGFGVYGTIGHTQPRRLAARAVATRIAQELESPLGELVGFKVRFDDRTRESCRVKLMTDGILLAELHQDRWLNQYDCLIIDEAHERSLNIDFLLGYLKNLLARRPELKLIITSATLNTQRFAEHFDNAPVIEVSGRTYPVAVRYREPEADQDTPAAIARAIDELCREGKGDILVFLPGERDIREAKKYLNKAFDDQLEVMPLFGRLTAKEQQQIFSQSRKRRVILSTNIAETSLTVPGIRYVIDTGVARISRYSYRTKVQRLPIERVSQASANQRAGRCGRVADGVCIRLYGEQDWLARPEYTDPELLRTNLASVILQMALLGLGTIESFPFVDTPDERYIKDGYRLLREIQALDAKDRITPIGRKIAPLPVDPRFGRMLVAAKTLGALQELSIIVAGLSIQDPRERPLEKAEQADSRHARFTDKESDFLTLFNLWHQFQEQKKALSHKQLRQWCFEHFLSYQRLFEWVDVHHQLTQLVGLVDGDPASSKAIHQAIVSGLLSNFGARGEEREYNGARGSKFQIFPGSGLAKQKPKWIVAAALVETSRLFARTVAPVRPEWIEKAASHLVKRSHSELHWQEKTGQVMAAEQVSLYGVVLIGKRWVKFSRLNPQQAQPVFIQGALVAGIFGDSPPKFLEHNLSLRADLEAIENKQRRRNILVRDSEILDFYASRIPDEVASRHSLIQWLKAIDSKTEQSLYMTQTDLLGTQQALPSVIQYPDEISLDGNTLKLQYVFDTNSDIDGVSLALPVLLLPQLTQQHLDYMVPGLVKDKIVVLIKGLPKQLRRNFVPAPDYAQACLDKWAADSQNQPLLANLTQTLQVMTGIQISSDAWSPLPPHLQVHIRVIDDAGNLVAQGRELQSLKQELQGHQGVLDKFEHSGDWALQKGLKTWSFGELPEAVKIEAGDTLLTRYPALRDKRTHVDQVLVEDIRTAQWETKRGLQRLFALSLPQQTKTIRQQIVSNKRLVLGYRRLGTEKELADDAVCAIVERVFLLQPVTTHTDFEKALERGRSELHPEAVRVTEILSPVLERYGDLMGWLNSDHHGKFAEAIEDIHHQLNQLVYPHFVRETPSQWLERLPVYLEAIQRRRETSFQNIKRDFEYQYQIAELSEEMDGLVEFHGDVALTEIRWMIEEFRVSLFAQGLKTVMPVSAKRIAQKLRALR